MPSTALLQRLTITGALVSIDAIAGNTKIAQTILDAGGDYLLAVKGNQANLKAIAMVEAQIEKQGQTTRAKRYNITSADLGPEHLARAVRSHWAIEIALH